MASNPKRPVSFDATRRVLLATGMGAGVSTLAAAAARADAARLHSRAATHAGHPWLDLTGKTTRERTQRLQSAIDTYASSNTPVMLPPGRFKVSGLSLRPGTTLIGVPGQTTFVLDGGLTFIRARDCDQLVIRDVIFDGANQPINAHQSRALLDFENCTNLEIDGCGVQASRLDGIALNACSGRLVACTIRDVRNAGVFALDSRGLDIMDNLVAACGDNGIQIWQSKSRRDSSRISGNRISDIQATSGGSGQNGNAINVFRADHVSVIGNTIENCAYSGVRGNAASNLQILNNTCHRIGEVALYAEFGFEGAMIANNLVTEAASGIVVTNFNEGGRLATVTGNLVRTLRRRAFEPVDKRGVGISAEADTVVSQNVVEDAETAGLALGWGPYRRNLIASQNIIRDATIGILVSEHEQARATLITQNIVARSRRGALHMARHDTPIGRDLISVNQTNPSLTLAHNLASDQA